MKIGMLLNQYHTIKIGMLLSPYQCNFLNKRKTIYSAYISDFKIIEINII